MFEEELKEYMKLAKSKKGANSKMPGTHYKRMSVTVPPDVYDYVLEYARKHHRFVMSQAVTSIVEKFREEMDG